MGFTTYKGGHNEKNTKEYLDMYQIYPTEESMKALWELHERLSCRCGSQEVKI
jgi:hypothetical protein